MMETMPRLLAILPGLVPPHPQQTYDKYFHLSEILEGDILLPVWWASADQASDFLKQTFPLHQVGRFCYHMLLAYRIPQPLLSAAKVLFFVRQGLHLHRQQKFDYIHTFGTNAPGVAGVILKWMTGAKLISELPGAPEDAYLYDSPHIGRAVTIKRLFAKLFLYFTAGNADCIKLLYPWQLQKYERLRKKPAVIVHDFVPVHGVPSRPAAEKYILLIGFPWYTKGADVLIRAFSSIALKFPDYTLKIMGFFPDRERLEDLARDCPRVEFVAPKIPYEDVLEIIGGCSVYVSASRTEGLARVLLEAMAARKPIVASAVGGTPYCIVDNESGLLFRSGDAENLAEKLSLVLSDPQLAARLADRAYEKARSEFDERAYVRGFQSILNLI
jgi:glycosyltransferase involved in cell wall biosynthesis